MRLREEHFEDKAEIVTMQGQPVQVVTSTIPVSTVQPAYVVPTQQALPLNVAVKETRILGILQIVIGCLSVLFGILSVAILSYWSGYVGFGIWTGLWIIVGGGLGVGSASNPGNGCLNGFHMAFNIISCCLSFIDFIIFAVSISYFRELEHKSCLVTDYRGYPYYNPYYSYTDSTCQNNKARRGAGVAFFTILLLCMLAEFVIALTASIYCCKAGCRNCCEPATPGVIIAQPHTQQHMVIQTSTAAPYSHAGQMPMYQPSTGYNPQQPHSMAPTSYTQAPAPTNVTYAQGMPPQGPPPVNPGYGQLDTKPVYNGPPPSYQ